jgi:hypothetical protein
MRELTKSMLSFSWAMPLYGMKQMLNMTFPRDMSRPFGEATDGFNSVTGAMREQLGSTMRSMFDAGDQIQRSMVDVMFNLGFGAFDPNTWMRSGRDGGGRSGEYGQNRGHDRGQNRGQDHGQGGYGQDQGYNQGQGSGGYGQGSSRDYSDRAADAGSRAAEYGARSVEEGTRAVTDAAYATAAALGYQPSGNDREDRGDRGQYSSGSSGSRRSNRYR